MITLSLGNLNLGRPNYMSGDNAAVCLLCATSVGAACRRILSVSRARRIMWHFILSISAALHVFLFMWLVARITEPVRNSTRAASISDYISSHPGTCDREDPMRSADEDCRNYAFTRFPVDSEGSNCPGSVGWKAAGDTPMTCMWIG